jgi:hypothetical protein
VARALTEFCEASRAKLEAEAEMVRQREQLGRRAAGQYGSDRGGPPGLSARLSKSWQPRSRSWPRVILPHGFLILAESLPQLQDNFNRACRRLRKRRHHRQRPAMRSRRLPTAWEARPTNWPAVPNSRPLRWSRPLRRSTRSPQRSRLLRAGDRSRRSGRIRPGTAATSAEIVRSAIRRWVDRGVLPDCADSQGHRRHRLPDQPAGTQCRRRGGAGR